MEEKKQKATTRAKRKWNEKSYDRIYPYIKAGKKELYLRAAEAGGYDSLNDFIESTADASVMKILGLTKEDFEEAVKAVAEKKEK